MASMRVLGGLDSRDVRAKSLSGHTEQMRENRNHSLNATDAMGPIARMFLEIFPSLAVDDTILQTLTI